MIKLIKISYLFSLVMESLYSVVYKSSVQWKWFVFSCKTNSPLVTTCSMGNVVSAEFGMYQKVCFVWLKNPILMQYHC